MQLKECGLAYRDCMVEKIESRPLSRDWRVLGPWPYSVLHSDISHDLAQDHSIKYVPL